MNPKIKVGRRAFTLLELLVVFVVFLILVAVLIPRRSRPEPAYAVRCMSNQRQVALALLMFAGDHEERFPSAISTTNGGAAETLAAGDVFPCYVILTNYFRDVGLFRCPVDKLRPAARGSAPFSRTNVSYFLSLDASPTNAPAMVILSGDRHLESGGKPVRSGLFAISASEPLRWTSELHSNKNATRGIVGFADGHVEMVKSENLSKVAARQPMQTNLVAIP